ncbi:MAG: hypothetical protein U5K71_08910 [Gracilimonas sp.]|nr:hypothetical protein [Gracilimonas sp.]
MNEEPIRGAQNVAENRWVQIGEYAEPIQQAFEVDNPQSLYLRLRSSRMAANLATFYYPDVARALGHLYIDETADTGSMATNRIELVDSDGSPTGEVLEKKVRLSTIEPPQPDELKAVHERRKVILTWQYPISTLQNDDKIVRFNVYNRQGDNWEQLNENPIVRINNFNEFEHIFTVPKMGVTLNLVVMPVNLTMEEGPGSEVLEYTVADEEPPSIITGLRAVTNNNGEVELTWPVSTEAHAAGYNLFRANRIKGNYEKLNEEPIPLLETFDVRQRPNELRSTYFYRISALDNSGNESDRSNASKADLPDYLPPSAPSCHPVSESSRGWYRTTELGKASRARELDFKKLCFIA